MTKYTTTPGRTGSSLARRIGYAIAAVVNAVLPYSANVWPGWRVLPFLSEDTPPVLPLVDVSLIVGTIGSWCCSQAPRLPRTGLIRTTGDIRGNTAGPTRQNDRVSTQTPPALVGIAHGTSSEPGQAAVAGLMRAVAAARPDLTVTSGFVDVQQPDAPATLAALPAGLPAVVVPLLLSAGYHVHVDLTEAVLAETGRSVLLAGALGPDDRIVAVLCQRLAEAGLRPDDLLVLAVAGSSDARAVAACRVVAERLAVASGREVALGFLSAATPRLACAVTRARINRPGRRVIASSYLLAPGYFQGLVEKAGADLVTRPLLTPDEPAPPLLVEVVVDRYSAAL